MEQINFQNFLFRPVLQIEMINISIELWLCIRKAAIQRYCSEKFRKFWSNWVFPSFLLKSGMFFLEFYEIVHYSFFVNICVGLFLEFNSTWLNVSEAHLKRLHCWQQGPLVQNRPCQKGSKWKCSQEYPEVYWRSCQAYMIRSSHLEMFF